MMTHPAYIPVDCGFHDRLLHWATLREQVGIVLTIHAAGEMWTGVILDVWTESGAEFLRLDGGQVIRLDRILSVNGHLSSGAGTCPV